MTTNRSENLRLIRLMYSTHEHTAVKLKSVVSNESKLSAFTNGTILKKTYMDAPDMSTQYLPLRADFQHKLRF
jgi:hypothetical protein